MLQNELKFNFLLFKKYHLYVCEKLKKMGKVTGILFFLLFFSTFCTAQKEHSKNAVYFEVGGNSLFYSINYDRQLKTFKNQNKLGFRLGFGGTLGYNDYLWDDDLYLGFYNFPVEVYYLIGESKHFLDIGIGIAPSFSSTPFDEGQYQTDRFINLSYRFQKPGNGFFFRTGLLVQSYNIYGYTGPFPWGRIAIGYSF